MVGGFVSRETFPVTSIQVFHVKRDKRYNVIIMNELADSPITTLQPKMSSPVLKGFSIGLSLAKLALGDCEDMSALLSALRLVLDLLDPVMSVWIVVIISAGFFLKRSELPKWTPPLPIILLLAYLIVGFAFGAMRNEYNGLCGVIYTISYGVGNGILFTGLSFIIYDIAHACLKRAKAKKAEKEAV